MLEHLRNTIISKEKEKTLSKPNYLGLIKINGLSNGNHFGTHNISTTYIDRFIFVPPMHWDIVEIYLPAPFPANSRHC